ncbi:sensor histidine kinase [Microbacterium mangrovi]|uniref:sensor histidine kinase n=1 Tax=Microbacterium mangrovi TaxID=1348253 RepID=UPI00068EBECD|nr:sensor histidine kinase [Microbacterium mangrovi]
MKRRSWAFDIAIAVAVAAAGVAEAFWGVDSTHRQGPPAAEAAVYVVTGLLLVIRRVAPLWCLAAIVAVSAVEFAIFGSPEGLGVAAPGAIAGYSVGRYVDRRRSWWGLVLIALLWIVWDGFDPTITTPLMRVEQLGWMGPWVVAWLIGALVRSQVLHAAQRRAVQREREARATVEERNRIARELHDVIGHSVSVMTVQASAVRRRLTPDQVQERQALETVEAVGREAMTEMRRVVGMLRQDDDDLDRHPAPGLDQVDALVAKFRDAGLPVSLRVDEGCAGLPPGLDLTAYRIVQEGLTNALRHASTPQHVDVSVGRGERETVVAIRDDGQGGDPHPEPGHGLLGMRERVALYGGTVVARRREGGGFELIARLPDEHGAAPAVPSGGTP